MLSSRVHFAVVLLLSLAAACPAAEDERASREAEGEGAAGDGEGASSEGEGASSEGEGAPGEGEGEGASGTWRSALFPATWTPGFALDDGEALHDFSYAGYHNGAAPPDLAPTIVVDGVDSTGADDATAAIQGALDVAAESGGVVELPAGLIRVDGSLAMHGNSVVLRGAGADLTQVFFTSTAPSVAYAGILTMGQPAAQGEDLALTADARARDFDVALADTSSVHVGDDVVLGFVITDAYVADHGMTGVWGPFDNTWQVIARRTVLAVDAVTVTLDVPLRSDMLTRDSASLRIESGASHELGLEHLGIASAVSSDNALAQNQVAAVEVNGVTDGWVRDVRSFASPVGEGSAHFRSGGIRVLASKRITVSDTSLLGAQNRGDGGNGYLLEISMANEVLVHDVVARAGRHNFIQNWGFGTSGCVFLRVTSSDATQVSASVPFPLPSQSEFHHSLATANLIDASELDDGWAAGNRGSESSGAGQSATENVFWNTSGHGKVRTFQWGFGYVVGTSADLVVDTAPDLFSVGVSDQGSAPVDRVEGAGLGATLDPPSLYEAQRALRLK